MYAEELIAAIRNGAAYQGVGRNEKAAWDVTIEKVCEVVMANLPHQPPVSVAEETRVPKRGLKQTND